MTDSRKPSKRPRLLEEFLKHKAQAKKAAKRSLERKAISLFFKIPSLVRRLPPDVAVSDFESLAHFCSEARLPFLLEAVIWTRKSFDSASLEALMAKKLKSRIGRKMLALHKKTNGRAGDTPVGFVLSFIGFGHGMFLVHNFPLDKTEGTFLCVDTGDKRIGKIFVHPFTVEEMQCLLT